MFVKHFILAIKNASIKVPHHTLLRKFISDQWIPLTKGQLFIKIFYATISSWLEKSPPYPLSQTMGCLLLVFWIHWYPLVTSGFPAQRAFNAESISMSCDHHMTAQSQQQQIAPKAIQCDGNLFQQIKNVWKKQCRDHSGYGLSQWEMTLQYNVTSHCWAHTRNAPCYGWLSPILK